MVNRNAGPNGWELYDLQADPGERTNVAARFPAVVRELAGAYDRWWTEVLPGLENENAEPPAVAPFTELYRKQFGG
jgi:arylsulfatase